MLTSTLSSAKVARTVGPLLLVDSREMREQAAHSYWSTAGEDDSDEGPRQYSSPLSGACKYHIFTFALPISYWVMNPSVALTFPFCYTFCL
jgi:hypothetical protein